MAYTTINKSTDYFNTLTYSGTGGNGTTTTQAITGAGFQPDWVWLKNRSGTQRHQLCDVVRGANNIIDTSRDVAEVADTQIINSFDSDGFTAGYQDQANDIGQTYVSWLWRAGNSQGSSNTDGSINTTYTSVNTTSGFSISQYTGTGSAATVGHGLGAVPKVMIIKNLGQSVDWTVYHASIGATKNVHLNATDAEATSSAFFNDTAPTSSVFSISSANGTNSSGQNLVAYCFAEKKGFSKFGSYTGNGSAYGPFIFTGFKPAWFMWKRSSSSGGWYISDSKRDTFNEVDVVLSANDNGSESDQGTTFDHDFLSNGIRIRNSVAAANSSGETFIYMAFAEEPLVSSDNTPATAR